MSRSLKRLVIVFLALPWLVSLVAGMYMVGMGSLEGQERSFLASLEWAAETLTTVGYGRDHTWEHPAMVLFVISVQFIGALMIFLIVPLVLLPFLEQRFETKLPTKVPPMEDHVVVYDYGPSVTTAIEELEKAGVEVLVAEEDPVEARRLVERKVNVISVRQLDVLLERSYLEKARALIANGGDDENAALIVGARQAGFEGEVLALVEEPVHRRPMMLAGASVVFTPRHVLGAALAARASERIGPTVAGIRALGRKLRTIEVKIQEGSPLAGKTLAESGIGQETGATVLGQWIGGRLQTAPTGSTRLEPSGILVIAGSEESLVRVEDLCEGTMTLRGQGPYIVGGYGEVGMKVVEVLRDAGEEVRIIDHRPRPGVDLVGDVLDTEILEKAGISSSRGMILALDTDTATLFATVIVQDLAPEVPIIARVNQAGNVERIHRAGADFALSLSQVSGQILTHHLLGEDAINIDDQLKLLRSTAEGLEGKTPLDATIRERTGCSVVAVERGDELLVEFSGDFRFAPGDEVYVCGSKPEIRRFREAFPPA